MNDSVVDTPWLRAIISDAGRYRWLRVQGGWPETEAYVSGMTPAQFDEMIDNFIIDIHE